MAKRMKLGESNRLDIASKAQDLTTTHDAAKMVKLAEDLKRIATDTTLTPYFRHRLYEDCLQQFREIQEKVVQNGISLIDTSRGHEEELLRDLLRDELEKYFARTSQLPQVSADTSVYDTPIQQGTPATVYGTSRTTDSTPRTAEAGDTPTLLAASAADGTPRTTKTPDTKKKAMSILRQKGVQWTSGGQTIFPRPMQSTYPENAYKPSSKGYKESTVQKAIDYIFNPTAKRMPATSGFDVVVFNIYHHLKSDKMFPEWLAKHPNLKNVHDQYVGLGTPKKWSSIN